MKYQIMTMNRFIKKTIENFEKIQLAVMIRNYENYFININNDKDDDDDGDHDSNNKKHKNNNMKKSKDLKRNNYKGKSKSRYQNAKWNNKKKIILF